MSAADVRVYGKQWLQERWNGVYSNQHGSLVVPHLDKTAGFVDFSDTPDGYTRVNIHAPILLDVNATSEMFKYVALNGTNWRFGALSVYDEDGINIEFDYSLLGEGMTGGQLNYLVQLVSQTALHLIDQLQPEFGGRPIYDGGTKCWLARSPFCCPRAGAQLRGPLHPRG